jgi:hypothetical protein
MYGPLLAMFVVLGCYLAARHLILAPQNRALVARPMKDVTLIGGRVSDFHATQVESSGIGAVARKIRYHDSGMALIVQYRVRRDTVPEELVMPFASRQIRDYWAMLLGADPAGSQRTRPYPFLQAAA